MKIENQKMGFGIRGFGNIKPREEIEKRILEDEDIQNEHNPLFDE